MKTLVSMICAALLATSAGAMAADDAQLAGWYVAPLFSYTKVSGQRGTGNGTGLLLALGHRVDHVAIEGAALYTQLASVSGGHGRGQISGGMLELVLGPWAPENFFGRFFAVAGFGIVQELNVPAEQRNGRSTIGEAGAGYLQPVNVFGSALQLRGEARYRYDFQKQPRAAGAPRAFEDVLFNLGVQIPFGEPPHALPTPAASPVAVVPPAAGATPTETQINEGSKP